MKSVTNRNIVLCIILSLVTCGIYGIYWFICISNDMCELVSDDGYEVSGGMAFLLTLVTCGIYGFYWAYKMGCKMDRIKGDGTFSILFLLLQIFGLGIVNYCIMQSEINNFASVD